MKRIRRISIMLFLASLVVLSILWVTAPQVIESAVLSPSAQDIVVDAWQLAQKSGKYEFGTEVVQTTYPAPALSHVGRAPREDRFVLEGKINQPEETMEMTLWQGGNSPSPSSNSPSPSSNSPSPSPLELGGTEGGRRRDSGRGVPLPGMIRADGLQMRVEGSRAYGRQVGGEWQEMDNVSDMFACGSDPLGEDGSLINWGAKWIGETGLEGKSYLAVSAKLALP